MAFLASARTARPCLLAQLDSPTVLEETRTHQRHDLIDSRYAQSES